VFKKISVPRVILKKTGLAITGLSYVIAIKDIMLLKKFRFVKDAILLA